MRALAAARVLLVALLVAAPGAAQAGDAAEGERPTSFAVVPGPLYNPSLGLGLMVIPMVMFHPDPDDAVSPPSVVMVNGLYAAKPPLADAGTRYSWMVGAGGKLYLDEDRWRVQLFTAYVDLFQQFYGVGGSTSGSSLFDYRMQGALLFVQPLRQVLLRELYLGPVLGYTAFRTTTDEPGNEAILDALGTGPAWTGQPILGVAAQYDTRDSQYYPSSGVNFNLRLSGSLKSSQEFLVLEPGWNQYFGVSGGNRVVIAYRIFAQLGFGDLPLGSYAYYGGRGTTLGYQTGEYLDKMMAGAEAEVRWLVWRRVGLEAGAGAGKVFPKLGEFGPEPWLPGAWGSATYRIMEKQDMRARVTLATSKSGGAFYFGIGQNF